MAISYLGSLLKRLSGLTILMFFLIAILPGDSRSYLQGAFEGAGLELGLRPINPWTLRYMEFHFGSDWVWQLACAFGRSLVLALLSSVLAFAFFLLGVRLVGERSAPFLDLGAGILLSLVSILTAPVLAIGYWRHVSFYAESWAAYLLAALAVSFVAVGSYWRFLVARYEHLENRDLAFGLRARGIPDSNYRWRHFLKLLAPDFLVLWVSKFAAYLSGVFVAELTFNLQGLGWYFSQAFQTRSSLLMLILALLTSVLYLLCNHGALALAMAIDPRRRHHA